MQNVFFNKHKFLLKFNKMKQKFPAIYEFVKIHRKSKRKEIKCGKRKRMNEKSRFNVL